MDDFFTQQLQHMIKNSTMKPKSNPPKKFKTAGSSGTMAKTKRSSLNSNLSTNYELMLRIYLVQKEQQLSKEGLKYPKVAVSKKVNHTKVESFTVWNNITHVFAKANNLIANFSRPAIGMLWK
jgi:hypothetical protein